MYAPLELGTEQKKERDIRGREKAGERKKMHGNVSIVFGDKMKKDRETQLSGTFALSKSKENPW